MNWGNFNLNRRYLNLVTAFVAVVLVVVWIVKLRSIQRAREGIVRVESQLSKGQELWKTFPPLSQRDKEELRRAQERLFRRLPKEKDVPAVLEDVSRVAGQYNLSNLSISTAEAAAVAAPGPPGAPVSGAAQAVAPQAVPKISEGSEKIGSFPIKMTFSADYREIANFLDVLQKIPRVVTIQSLQLQRGVPLVVAEVVLKAYYQRGDFSAGTK